MLLGQKTEQQSLSLDNTPHPQIDFQHHDDDHGNESNDHGVGLSQGKAVGKPSTKNNGDGDDVVEEVVVNNSLLGANLPVATSLDDKIPVTSGADLYYKDNGCERYMAYYLSIMLLCT